MRNLAELSTPALCVDVDALQRNIDRMAAFFRDRECGLRPHVKAHKTPEIAKRQALAGAAGFTCATIGEAEILADHLFSDLLIANEILDPTKVDRLRALAERTLVTVAVDSLEGVELLRHLPIGALVDVNVGMPRCGVAPSGAVEIARAIEESEMHLRGVMGYEGHAQALDDPGKREHVATKSMAVLLDVVDSLRRAGLDVSVVSAGGTGTYDITGAIPGVTEIQAGSYALMDTRYGRTRPEFEEALRCLTTVLSVGPGIAVLDAGLKTLAVDHGNPELEDGFPASVMFLSDEHTTVATSDGFRARPGDRVWLRPSHVDPTVNLHDRLYVIRRTGVAEDGSAGLDADVVDVWAVEARGYR